MFDLPTPSVLPSLPQERRLQILDMLFEPSPELHYLIDPVISSQLFSSYEELIDTTRERISALVASASQEDRDVLFRILSSHPRLGYAPVAAADHMSEFSKNEQEQLNAGAEEQAMKLQAMNIEYENRFPGLIFITFVDGRNRDAVIREMRQRIDRGNQEQETEDAIQGMCDIAKSRVRKLQEQQLSRA